MVTIFIPLESVPFWCCHWNALISGGSEVPITFKYSFCYICIPWFYKITWIEMVFRDLWIDMLHHAHFFHKMKDKSIEILFVLTVKSLSLPQSIPFLGCKCVHVCVKSVSFIFEIFEEETLHSHHEPQFSEHGWKLMLACHTATAHECKWWL